MIFKTKISKITIEPDDFPDEIKKQINCILNIIESQGSRIAELEADKQSLKDEINRLKGEQGKPNIRANTKNSDISSEDERRSNTKPTNLPKKKAKTKRNHKVDQEVRLSEKPNNLPEDAIYKGIHETITNDLVIKRVTIKFKRSVWYSPSLNKTYYSPLPNGYKGEYGPGVRSFVLSAYEDGTMSQGPLTRLLNHLGISIVQSTVNRMLNDPKSFIYKEKQNIIYAGKLSSQYQQTDDTGSRVRGKNWYTHIVCNKFFSTFFTRPRKDRLTITEVLAGGINSFRFNKLTFDIMESCGLPIKSINLLKEEYKTDQKVMREDVDQVLNKFYPDPYKHTTNRKIILESAAISAYRQSEYHAKILMGDLAGQFDRITVLRALCWVHEGRFYKKLNPMIGRYRTILKDFITDFWRFYRKLCSYRKNPTDIDKKVLNTAFDELFSRSTGYDDLDKLISKTRSRKQVLLLVLDHPEIELHNNDCESGIRAQVRRRDVSLHNQNEKGVEAKDARMTLSQTAKKLGVNLYEYTYDRITQKFQMPALADLIIEKASLDKLVPYTDTS